VDKHKWCDGAWHTPRENAAAWILGSGPSLDAADLDALAGQDVYAVNAAAVYAYNAKCRATSWWCANNANAIEQSADLVPAPWRMIVLDRCRDVIGRYAERVETLVTYTKAENFPKHTTTESVLHAAAKLGYRTAVLVGVDCDPTAPAPYAARAAHQKCIYEDAAKRVEYMTRFVAALESCAMQYADTMRVVGVSPVFPARVIPRVPWCEAMRLFGGHAE
jgi:hypothetical protein